MGMGIGIGMDRINGSQVQLVMNIYDIDTSKMDRSDDALPTRWSLQLSMT